MKDISKRVKFSKNFNLSDSLLKVLFKTFSNEESFILFPLPFSSLTSCLFPDLFFSIVEFRLLF